VPFHVVYRKFLSLAATSIFFSFILALFLYGKSLYADSSALAEGGNTGENLLAVLIMCYGHVYLCTTILFPANSTASLLRTAWIVHFNERNKFCRVCLQFACVICLCCSLLNRLNVCPIKAQFQIQNMFPVLKQADFG